MIATNNRTVLEREMSRRSDKACYRKKLRYRREDDICGVSQSCSRGSPSIVAATFCITIDCANGMPRRWQFSSDKLLLSPSVPTADYFLSMREAKVPSVRSPVRHVIFATEIRTPGEPSSHCVTRPYVSKRDSFSFGMDYRHGAAFETIYRYDISHAVLSLCNIM